MGETPGVLRVLHVDDGARMRYWLSVALDSAPDLEVVAVAGDSREGIELASELHPDVIVLDQQMPDLDGIDALPLLRAACPEARVVMWSNDPLVREQALERGATGFVDKAAPLDQLVSALRHVPEPRPGAG